MLNSYYYKLFIFIGAHPEHSTGKLHFIFNTSVVICFFVLVSLKCYYDEGLNNVDSLIIFFIVKVKFLTLVLEKKKIKQLLNATKNFWEPNVEDHQITFLLRHLKRVKIFYHFLCVSAPIIFAVQTFVTKRSSIFNAYIPPQKPFKLLYVVESYLFVFEASTFMCFNILICSFIILIVVQLRLLNLRIRDINLASVESEQDLAGVRRELKSIIRYQQFLIRHITDMNELLCVPLALLITSTVTMFCINMYILSTTEDIIETCRIIITSSAVVFEFFMVYGLPAQLLMDESATTADFIYYECKWYLPKLKSLRSDFFIMIMRSQKQICLRAANYHVISNQTVLLMLRTAYSFYAFVREVT